MFSGIVSEIGKVTNVCQEDEQAVLEVEAEMFSPDIGDLVVAGDSIALSGVCLTVTELDGERNRARFDASSETLRKTNLGRLEPGAQINLERALQIGARLDGHWVQGHVDAVSEVSGILYEGATKKVEFRLPKDVSPFIAPKGAVTIDGVSLTVGEVEEESFSVYIIPYTLRETTLQFYQPGHVVNIEVDCLARYVARLMECR